MRLHAAVALPLCLLSFTTQAALLGRAPFTAGGTDYQAYYEDILNVTWLANANLAASESFGLPVVPPPGPSNPFTPGPGEVTTRGQMRYDTALTWLGRMNAASYLGASDWRLPDMDVNGDSTVETCAWAVPCYDNEMGHLFAYYNVYYGPARSLFPNIAGDYYWSGTDTSDGLGAWVFYFPMNESATFSKSSPHGLHAWPVLDGDIGVIPIPAAVWLFGSALGVMGWMRRRAAA